MVKLKHFHDQVYVPDLQFQKSHFFVYIAICNSDYIEHSSKKTAEDLVYVPV